MDFRVSQQCKRDFNGILEDWLNKGESPMVNNNFSQVVWSGVPSLGFKGKYPPTWKNGRQYWNFARKKQDRSFGLETTIPQVKGPSYGFWLLFTEVCMRSKFSNCWKKNKWLSLARRFGEVKKGTMKLMQRDGKIRTQHQLWRLISPVSKCTQFLEDRNRIFLLNFKISHLFIAS